MVLVKCMLRLILFVLVLSNCVARENSENYKMKVLSTGGFDPVTSRFLSGICAVHIFVYHLYESLFINV